MKALWAALLVLGGQDPEEGRRLLRENRLEEARAVFERILAGSPQDAEALVGAGFTALRQHRLAEAQAYFRRALQAGSPVDADIPYGLALCHWRLGEVEAARRHLQEALKRDPRHGEARSLMGRLPEALRPVPPPPPRPAALQVPFRATTEAFQIREDSGWRTVFLKGVNLGAALPGHFATEFPGKAAYRGWLKEMGELGINVLRVYTIHPPAFYEALREHNLKAERPIYLLHGLWVEPPPGNDFEDPAWFGEWKEDMRRLVDLLHGRASFAPRPGFTGGNYRADVSPWWMGTILGREWEPFDVVAYDRRKPGLSDWRGRFLEVRQGTATEVFMAKAMDAFIAVEHDGYHIQRPLAFSNWPTLDPLEHPTETSYGEEQVLRKRLGLPYDPNPPHEVYDDDMVALDLEKYTALESYQGGLFASYHVYPNYPEFINLDPTYNRTLDPEGVNGFYGYLLDLRRYHRKHPVVVSEYGISNSRSPAHWQPQGMTHGGLDEKAQARMLQRLTRNIQDAGCAGAVVFAWMDEWFKKTWQVEPLERPPERGPLWFNALSAEENYGLIGHHPGRTGPSILIDGRRGDWDAVPAYQRGDGVELKLLADEGWLHVGVFWQGPRPDWASERFVLGIDTFDPALGNRRLPFGVPLRSAAGFEFAVNLSGEGCEVYVDAPYAFEPHRRARPTRSIAHEDGPWRIVESETNRLRVGRDGTVYPAHRYELGILHRGTQDREDPDFNSLAEWNEGEGFLEVRIPWTLLQVTDPSSHQVLQDPPDPPRGSPMGTLTTDGFRAALVRVRNAPKGRYEAVATLPAAQEGELPLPPLFTWKPWQQPTWHPFRKLAFGAVKEAFAALAETPQPPPPVRLQPLPPPPPPPEAVPEDLLEKARAARANRAWEEALAAYGALLAREPGQETAAVERAQTLAWAGRYREAAEAWKAVAERHPGRRAEADLQRAQVAAWGKDYLQAVAVLEPYVRQGDRTALLDSARYLSWAGRFRASLALTEGWLARHPEDRQALAAHAQVLSWDGRLAESRAAYRRLLALGEAPEARLGLARVALWSGRFDEARAELDPLSEALRATPEVQLLQAQLALGEGRRREAVATLRPLAVEGPGGEDARSLLRAAAETHGPSVELGFARTDSSDDLRMDETRLRARLPLGDGHVGLQAARHASSLEAPWALQRAADPSSLALFLVQPFGRWTLNAEAGRISGVGEAPASFHRIGLGYRLGPGLELSAAHGRSLVVATPEAASRRIAQQGFDLAFAWTGMADALGLQAGTAELSAGNRRVTWSATYGHRWRVSPFTLGAGATLRSLAYSESLPLGFWNPERYRFQGLTGSLLYTRNRFVFTGEAQGGRQSLAPGAWTRAWSCSLEARLGLGRSPFTLVGGWSASTAGLNAALPFEPTAYSERSFRFGVRVAGWGPGGSRR